MAAELLLVLVRVNIAAALAVLVVLPLRWPLRCWFGAQHAYAAWLIVPLAAAGSLMPTDFATGAAGPVERTSDHLRAWLSTGDRVGAVTLVWLLGILVAIALVASRHARFSAAVRAGRAGPAAVGVIEPRLILPTDFETRFSEAERRLVRAHELAHIDRLDNRYNAAAALATWVCWFNPLLHLAVRTMRLDQELACDATVLDRLPGARRIYAETLLRTHGVAAAPVLGCQWHPGLAHPLVARVRAVGAAPPSDARRELGAALLLTAWALAFTAAWAVQPPFRVAEAPRMILMDLEPPDAAETRLAAAVYQVVEARP